MMMHTILIATMAGSAMAEVVTCDLSGIDVSFEIDRTQFAPPINKGEPIQRRVTTVTMGDAQFPAEPILIGNTRGFWAEGMGGSDVMLVMRADGSAVYADSVTGERLTGTCEVLQ